MYDFKKFNWRTTDEWNSWDEEDGDDDEEHAVKKVQ
jgi:hypothetical protein